MRHAWLASSVRRHAAPPSSAQASVASGKRAAPQEQTATAASSSSTDAAVQPTKRRRALNVNDPASLAEAIASPFIHRPPSVPFTPTRVAAATTAAAAAAAAGRLFTPPVAAAAAAAATAASVRTPTYPIRTSSRDSDISSTGATGSLSEGESRRGPLSAEQSLYVRHQRARDHEDLQQRARDAQAQAWQQYLNRSFGLPHFGRQN